MSGAGEGGPTMKSHMTLPLFWFLLVEVSADVLLLFSFTSFGDS